MKKYWLAIFVSFISVSTFAQKNISGIWQGKISAGVDLTAFFHIKEEGKNISATLDFPDGGIRDMSASSIAIKEDSILVEVPKLNGKYLGRIINDSTINGYWIQGQQFLLNLHKVKEMILAKRPQTPKPPFPYKSENIVYFNSDKSIQYGATMTIPNGKGPFPAVLLITGSGQQNRDEEILQHKPFAVIADYLTKRGFVVLRVDDRGMGQTTGDVLSATSRDFANDAEVSLDYLKKRKEVDNKKIGLLGHSEGGMIAQIIASERKDINFLVFLAAPGENNLNLMKDQNEAILAKVGMSKSYIDQYLELYTKLLSSVIKSDSLEEAKQNASKLIDEWRAKTPSNVVTGTTGITNEETKQRFINAFVPAVYSPWFKYFLSYDPDPILQKISAKVLALNGNKDIQVVSKTNLPAMESSLKKSQSNDYDIKELKGLNHLFQHCKICNVQEYGYLEETIAPEVLNMIGDWLERHVKS